MAIKEETIEAAFKVLRNALDPPIDEFQATARFRNMVWARGVRIEVFFTLLWKEAKRAGFFNRQVCAVLVTQLPSKATSSLKRWIQERKDNIVSDAQMREFIGLVQQSLRQMEIPLDLGAREAEGMMMGHCKVVDIEPKEDQNIEPEEEPDLSSVYKIRQFTSGRRYQRSYRGAIRGPSTVIHAANRGTATRGVLIGSVGSVTGRVTTHKSAQ